MNILFLSMGRLNSIKDSGLYTDLLRKFKDNGHQIYVASPLEEKADSQTKKYTEDDVTFLKVKVGNLKNVNLLKKGISTITLESKFLKAIKIYYSEIKFDLVLYTTPPITFSRIINYIKKRDNAKTYLMLKDIFPQNAVDLGMFSSNGPIYHYFRQKEKRLYKYSDYIGCMSEVNVKYILENNPEVPKNKVEIAPNSITPVKNDTDYQKVKAIRAKYNIPLDKSVFIYGGNLGKPQGIDFLIECIKKNEANRTSYFLIVGSGTEFNKLKHFF